LAAREERQGSGLHELWCRAVFPVRTADGGYAAGGQDWKAVVAGLAKKSREELLELFKDSGVLRELFNGTQEAA